MADMNPCPAPASTALTAPSTRPSLQPPAEPHSLCSLAPSCLYNFLPLLCRLLPAVPTSPLPTPALPPPHLDFRATSFWKLPWHSSCALAKLLSAPKATWTSLFPFPSTLCYNNLFTRLPIMLLWAKETTVFFNLSPQPPSQVLSLNPPDLHL